MKVLIVGAGNMGLTYARSFVNASVVSRDDLYVLERTEGKSEQLHGITNNPIHTRPSSFVRNMDLIILGVKPQDFTALADSLTPYLRKDQLILSIMAGITIESVQFELNIRKVVRAMPNLPAQVGQGMTVFTTSDEVSRHEIFTVQNLLNTTGKTLHTDHEHLLDAATAISGSGPAFVYLFMHAMIEAGCNMGFNESESQLLVRQTFEGAIDLLNRNSLSCEEWIRRVSSKGGTTEAALAFFDSRHFERIVEGGLQEARKRARELSTSAGHSTPRIG